MKLSSWAHDTRERTLSSTAGAMLTAWVFNHDPRVICGFGAVMGAYTLLKCVASRRIGRKGTASMTWDVEYADGVDS